MADNLTLPSKEVIIALANRDNPGSAVTVDMVDFGLPTVNSDVGATRNTKLTLTAKAGSGYSGSRTLDYNRVQMSTIPGNLSIEFPVGDATRINDLLPDLRARFPINLQVGDVVDAALPTFTGAPHEKLDVQISAHADALNWIGSLTIKIVAEDIPLENVLVNTTLNGLVYEPPVA